MKAAVTIYISGMVLAMALVVPSFGNSMAYCQDWDGVCPAGTTRRSEWDWTPCSDDECDVMNCCGETCNSFHVECPAGKVKRGDYDFHMVWNGNNPQDECCISACFDNFQGTCPYGKQVRPEWDYHNCGENCQSPDECCVDTPAYCKDWNGTCPFDTRRRSAHDMHQCDDGKCSVEECCGQTCHNFEEECGPGYEKRPYHDHHTFYSHSIPKDECCIKRCFNNFFGECPHNKTIRGEHDWHNCGENCHSPQECCVESEYECTNWNGQCPEGEEKIPDNWKKTFREWSGDGHDSATQRCCGKKCSSDFRACPDGTQKRPDEHESMFKPGEENSYAESCCAARCFDAFHGTCPTGMKVRDEEDWHSCRNSHEDRCQDPAECCQGYCEDNFNGTCPDGTLFHPSRDCLSGIGHNECTEDRCCSEPEACPEEIQAPAGYRNYCTESPTDCQMLEQYVCSGGCFHSCAYTGANKGFLTGYATMMKCNTESWCGGTFNGGHFDKDRARCKSGSCCGYGTMYRNGRCVVDYGSSLDKCREGHSDGAFKCISSSEVPEHCD